MTPERASRTPWLRERVGGMWLYSGKPCELCWLPMVRVGRRSLAHRVCRDALKIAKQRIRRAGARAEIPVAPVAG